MYFSLISAPERVSRADAHDFRTRRSFVQTHSVPYETTSKPQTFQLPLQRRTRATPSSANIPDRKLAQVKSHSKGKEISKPTQPVLLRTSANERLFLIR